MSTISLCPWVNEAREMRMLAACRRATRQTSIVYAGDYSSVGKKIGRAQENVYNSAKLDETIGLLVDKRLKYATSTSYLSLLKTKAKVFLHFILINRMKIFFLEKEISRLCLYTNRSLLRINAKVFLYFINYFDYLDKTCKELFKK